MKGKDNGDDGQGCGEWDKLGQMLELIPAAKQTPMLWSILGVSTCCGVSMGFMQAMQASCGSWWCMSGASGFPLSSDVSYQEGMLQTCWVGGVNLC